MQGEEEERMQACEFMKKPHLTSLTPAKEKEKKIFK